MLHRFKLAIACAWLTFPVFGEEPAPVDSCTKPTSNPQICYPMKALRSHIYLLDSDRDLVRGNFELIAATADSMYQIIARLMTNRSTNEHLTKLGPVLEKVRKLKVEARDRNPASYTTANSIKRDCANCHSLTGSASSGNTWNEIFARSWDEIPERCNAPERNPFVCKHMYGLSTAFAYYEAAAKAEFLDFKLAGLVATELKRQAHTLVELGGGVHESGRQPLVEVLEHSAELEKLASRQDPYVYQLSAEIHQACGTCHTPQ